MDTQTGAQESAEKLISQVQTEMLVFTPTFVREFVKEDKRVLTKWHEVVDFLVSVYDAMGGGYGALVSARTRCGQQFRIDRAEITHYKPVFGICAGCNEADQQDRANSR